MRTTIKIATFPLLALLLVSIIALPHSSSADLEGKGGLFSNSLGKIKSKFSKSIDPAKYENFEPISPYKWGDDFYSTMTKLCQSETLNIVGIRQFEFVETREGETFERNSWDWSKSEFCDSDNFNNLIPKHLTKYEINNREILISPYSHSVHAYGQNIGGVDFEMRFEFGLSENWKPLGLDARKILVGYFLTHQENVQNSVVLPLTSIGLFYPIRDDSFPDYGGIQTDSKIEGLASKIASNFSEKYVGISTDQRKEYSKVDRSKYFKLTHLILEAQQHRDMYDLVEVKYSSPGFLPNDTRPKLKIVYNIWKEHYLQWEAAYQKELNLKPSTKNLDDL